MNKIEKAYQEKCYGRKINDLDAESSRILNLYLSYTSGFDIDEKWLEPATEEKDNNKIKTELEGYIKNGNNNTLFAVLQAQKQMGLIDDIEHLKSGVMAFISGFSNTLQKGYIDYYTKVLTANPNLSTVLDFRVWALDIFEKIMRDSGNNEGINIRRADVEKYCKEYHHPNDYK